MKRPTGLLLMLVMVLMALQVGLKKPVCIDSNIVYKIDRVNVQEMGLTHAPESVYSCSQYKTSGFSLYFSENIDQLNRQVSVAEMQLNRLGLRTSVAIQIDESKSQWASSADGQITISRDLLENTSALQSQILQQALRQSKLREQAQLAEMFADFIADTPNDSNQFLKVWNHSFNELSLIERFNFKLDFISQLAQFKATRLESDTEALNRFAKALQTSGARHTGVFAKALNGEMQRVGLAESKQKFDLILQVENRNELNLDEIKKWSAQNARMKMALQDNSGLYVLPYMIPVSSGWIHQAKTEWRLLFQDPSFFKEPLDEFFENTEHLVLVDAQSGLKQIRFGSLFKKGPQAFLAENKKLDFVQFHMASLQFRSAYLRPIKNYFSWLKDGHINSIKQKGLGWQSQFWSLELQAYKPVAVYDAIQYYRVN